MIIHKSLYITFTFIDANGRTKEKFPLTSTRVFVRRTKMKPANVIMGNKVIPFFFD